MVTAPVVKRARSVNGPTLADAAQAAVRPCGTGCSLIGRSGHDDPWRRIVGVPETRHDVWYGFDPGFQLMLEAGLRSDPEHAGKVRCELVTVPATGWPRVLVYRHTGLDVPSVPVPEPVRIEFHEYPGYPTFDLNPRDYPRVFADPGAASPHRQPDDGALCLWQPRDPAERRWVAADGLGALFSIISNHLFFEVHWRATGEWLADEAPHGFPEDRVSTRVPRSRAGKQRVRR